jgi:hypothetical protein
MGESKKHKQSRRANKPPTRESLSYGTEYWATRTPEERLAAMELMRRINYGAAATARMDKTVFEVVKRDDLKDE